MRRVLIVVFLSVFMVMTSAGTALAGEWNPGRFDSPGGDLPAKDNANSECLFNGRDEPDESSFGAGDGEEWFGPGIGGDDALWASAPAGGKVQSAGQAVVIGLAPPGTPGVACNGHLNPLK